MGSITSSIAYNSNTYPPLSKEEYVLIFNLYVMPTGMEEAPKVALDIHCLQRGGGAALTLNDQLNSSTER